MGRLILLALLASLVTCCVLWLLVHATLLVIGLLEAALALGAFIVLRVSAQLGSGGPLLVGGIIAIALWHSPELRVTLRTRLDQARLRRRMTAAFRRCCIVGYFGDARSTLRNPEFGHEVRNGHSLLIRGHHFRLSC